VEGERFHPPQFAEDLAEAQDDFIVVSEEEERLDQQLPLGLGGSSLSCRAGLAGSRSKLKSEGFG